MQVRLPVVLFVIAFSFAACGGTVEETVGQGSSVAISAAIEATTSTTLATTTSDPVLTTLGDDSTPSTAATTTTEATMTLSGFQITAVVFGDHVALTNNTDADVSLDGWWLCNRPSYVPLSGTLAPGETIDITSGSLGGLTAAGGEVGLYTSRSFSDSTAMVDYVAWGSGGGRTSVAESAGLWGDGDSAPNDGTGVVRTDSASGSGSWISR